MTKELCPHCGKDLTGKLIWETFIEKGYTEKEADETAAMFGATRDEGYFGLKLGIYDLHKDRTTHYICPDCKETL